MKSVKAMLRKHESVLPQIVRRLFEEERNLIHNNQLLDTGKTLLKKKHSEGPVLSTGVGKQFKELHYKSMILKCDVANCCVILQNESVVKILNFIEHNNKVSIIGLELGNGKKKTCLIARFNLQKLEYTQSTHLEVLVKEVGLYQM